MTVSVTSAETTSGRVSLPSAGDIRIAVLLVFPLALLMAWPKMVAVWQTGTFFDTDDAMRAVQVRDWMAGQGWFDLVAHRLDPPAGVFMHWSRVIDVPLAALIRGFELITTPEDAERLARIAFPLTLFAGLIAAAAWVARLLAGPRAVLPAAFLLLLSGMTFGEFQPGRIHHHPPQILLLMLMTGTTLLSLDPKRARMAGASGFLAAMSLAIGLENMPFITVLAATPPIAWALIGGPYRRTLVWQAIGVAIGTPSLFAATVGPARYGVVAADAYSIAHVAAASIGAAGLLVLSAWMPRLGRPYLRWLALASLTAFTAVVIIAAFPGAVHDPYYNMDPLVIRVWLSHVTEAQSALEAMRERPATFTVLICPLLACGAATAVAAWSETGLARGRWLVVIGLLCMGGIGLMWGIRVASSIQPLAVLGGAWAVARGLETAMRRPGIGWMIWPLALCVPFSSVAWALVPEGDMSADIRSQLEGGAACREARMLAPLAGLGQGLAFAPIDAGAHILAHTQLSVLGAPYRSHFGNRTVIQGFLAEPEAARRIVEATGAAYVVLCPGEAQVQVMAKMAPQGLAAELVGDHVPSWLKRLPIEGTLYRVYAVDQPPPA